MKLVCISYYESFSVPVIIGRFFNTPGIRQCGKYGMVVPRFIQQAMNGEDLTVYGNGQQVRAFCDVRDTVQGILAVLENPEAEGQIFNIGNPELINILELAECIKFFTKSNSNIVFSPFPETRNGNKDIFFRQQNIEKIHQLTGWYPIRNWQKTIKKIIESKMPKPIIEKLVHLEKSIF